MCLRSAAQRSERRHSESVKLPRQRQHIIKQGRSLVWYSTKMLHTQCEASWNVNRLEEVPKTIDMLKWMGGLSCSRTLDLHSMITSRHTQPFPSWDGFFSQRLQEMLNWHHRELSAEEGDWLPGYKRELEKGIKFLTPCSSCRSLPSSEIVTTLLLRQLNPGWHFWCALIWPLWSYHATFSCLVARSIKWEEL